MKPDKSVGDFPSVQCPAEWHVFDWYNGSLNADEKSITHNLVVATNTNEQQQQMAGVSDANKSTQLALADQIKGMLASLK